MTCRHLVAILSALSLAASAPAQAQQADSSLLTLARIYGSPEFASQPFGPARWLGDGAAYTTLEATDGGEGQDIVRYDVETGKREVLVSAQQLTPQGGDGALEVEDYAWSPDQRMLLVFTNTQPVWRLNTRGDYWVLDRTSGKLRQLGGRDAKPSTLMFAKFSPDGGRVAYVRENNLYVEDLASGAITPLTTDGSRTLINGTFDWVYEEELMNYYADGWRWSPDGRSIAYWQLNADSVKNFSLVNNTDSLYSRVIEVQYPKVGEANSAARIGIVPAAGGATRWLDIAGDPRNHYIPRMEWAAGSDEVILQRLNRLQNTIEVMLGERADRRGANGAHREGLDLGRRGGRPRVAQRRTPVHLGERARRLEARLRGLARRQDRAAGVEGQLRRAGGQGHRRQGRLALLRRLT